MQPAHQSGLDELRRLRRTLKHACMLERATDKSVCKTWNEQGTHNQGSSRSGSTAYMPSPAAFLGARHCQSPSRIAPVHYSNPSVGLML